MDVPVYFIDYVYSFYGPNGVYKLNATREQVAKAAKIAADRGDLPVLDSIGRETIRFVLQREFGLWEQQTCDS